MKCIRSVTISFALVLAISLHAQTRPVSVRDCVLARYVEGVWLNTAADLIAYMVRSPDLSSNTNIHQLYFRSASDGSQSNGRLILSGADLSGFRWSSDGKTFSALVKTPDDSYLYIGEASTGSPVSRLSLPRNVNEYVTSDRGDVVVYTTRAPLSQSGPQHSSPNDNDYGYLLEAGPKGSQVLPDTTIYITHKLGRLGFGKPQRLELRDPWQPNLPVQKSYVRNLSLSPDGRNLLFTQVTDTVPSSWKDNQIVQFIAGASSLFSILMSYDLKSGTGRVAFQMADPTSTAFWSSDSRSFLINAPSPIGTEYEQNDAAEHNVSMLNTHMFRVDLPQFSTALISNHAPYNGESALSWLGNGDIVVHSGESVISEIRPEGRISRVVSDVRIPSNTEDRYTNLVSDGARVFGVHEAVSVPQDLFVYSTSGKMVRRLTDLNSELRRRTFAEVRTIHWTTALGLEVDGFLFVPPSFSGHERLPLVIQTKGDSGRFTCDSGSNHDPSFAPQPIANAGMFYLVRTTADDFNFQKEVEQRPKSVPGGIGEAVQQMDIWDSAVQNLTEQGLIDPSKVGIIGFSRTGWQVEYDLIHAKTRFAAATAADNIQYSLSEYWLLPWLQSGIAGMYGGAPFGPSLKSWKEHSITFNLDKLHTPLLMEVMGAGAGRPYEDENVIQLNVAVRYEITKGLSDLHKPFEIYYYPNESHQPEHPRARLASLQRNVDWYRFWLQGYIDQAPSKREQYRRWLLLKQLQQDRVPHSPER